MGKIKDLTGQKFGKLTVLEMTNERRNRQVVWKCICDCGNISYVVGQALRNGHTKTCGCSWTEKRGEDLSGQRFGELTVVEKDLSYTSSSRAIIWKCKCDCGKYRSVSASDLRGGKIVRCVACNSLIPITRKPPAHGPIKDHTNERFGMLIALEPTTKRIGGKVVWRCLCDCGKEVEAPSNALTTGKTTSCGCQNRKSVGEEVIYQILVLNNIKFCREVTLPAAKSRGVLRYDFAILNKDGSISRLIEFDGIQHYQAVEFFGGEQGLFDTQERDKIKNRAAKEANIPLVRIPYYKKDTLQLADLLGDDFLC